MRWRQTLYDCAIFLRVENNRWAVPYRGIAGITTRMFVEKVLGNHISNDSTSCTDWINIYIIHVNLEIKIFWLLRKSSCWLRNVENEAIKGLFCCVEGTFARHISGMVFALRHYVVYQFVRKVLFYHFIRKNNGAQKNEKSLGSAHRYLEWT